MPCKRRVAALCLFLFCGSTYADTQFLFDTRYLWLQSRTDEQIQTLGIQYNSERFSLRAATRVNHSGLNWNAIDYSAHADYWLLSWARASARLVHLNWLPDPSSSTTLLGTVALDGRFPSWLSYFFEFGFYNRLSQFKGGTLLPNFLRPALAEYDYALALGLRVHPNETWLLQMQLSTLDLVDVYNFNNPVVEFASQWAQLNWMAKAYLRYQFLLGFGLRDAWVAGLQFSLPLSFGK